MFKNIFVVVTILISLAFFELKIFPSELMSRIQFALIPVMVALFFFQFVYDNGRKIVSGFKVEIYMIWFAVLLSMFGAFYFRHQGFGVTAIAQRAMYFYLFYFLLLRLKIKPSFFINLFLYFSVLIIIIYAIQTVIYPREILYSKMGIDRGTLRIFIPGVGYLVLAYYYAFNRFLNNLHYKYALFCLFALTIFILLGSRQLLGSIIFITILNLILSKKITSKYLVYILGGLALIPVFFLFRNIFTEIIEVSKSQGQSFRYDIRVQAVTYFITEFFPNTMSYFTGNGASGGQSSYNLMLEYLAKSLGYYQSDIGIIGEFTKFGILFVVANLLILGRIAFMKLPQDYMFLKYANLINVLTVFTGDVMSVMHGIVLISVMLYLIDVSRYQPKLQIE